MSRYFELLPAYGRDYKSAKEMKADFLADKDFVDAQTRSYTSRKELFEMYPTVNVIGRYKRLTMVTTLAKNGKAVK